MAEQELMVRDQLVEQLSEELYRLMVQHPELFARFYQARQAETANAELMQTLQEQLRQVEGQITFYQEQINLYQEQMQSRQDEIGQLQDAMQEMGDRNQMLEKVIQEMPEVYRQKFAERLTQVKAKVESLQQENRQLRAELRNMHGLLAAQSRQTMNLPSLPSLQPTRVGLIPSFGNV